MAFQFEQLRVWQIAIELSSEVSRLVKTFPSEERYVLASQIQRAADSVALNIAEGSTGQSKKEFSRFLGIALRSALEVVSCLFLGKNRNIVSEDNFKNLYSEYSQLVRQIQSLRNSLKE